MLTRKNDFQLYHYTTIVTNAKHFSLSVYRNFILRVNILRTNAMPIIINKFRPTKKDGPTNRPSFPSWADDKNTIRSPNIYKYF